MAIFQFAFCMFTRPGTFNMINPWDLKKWGSMTCPNFKAQLPSGYVKIAIENGHLIVDLPTKN